MPKRTRRQAGLTASERSARWRKKNTTGRLLLKDLTPEARNDILPRVWVHQALPFYKVLNKILPRSNNTIMATILGHLGMPENETQIAFSPASDGHESCRAFGPMSPLNVGQQNALRESLGAELKKALGLPTSVLLQYGSERRGETWASFIAYDGRSKTGQTQSHVDSYWQNPDWMAYTVVLRYANLTSQTPQ